MIAEYIQHTDKPVHLMDFNWKHMNVRLNVYRQGTQYWCESIPHGTGSHIYVHLGEGDDLDLIEVIKRLKERLK